MSDLFSDEDEATNIFDEEEEEEEEENAKEPATKEDVDLASFGLNPKYFKAYHKRFPDKKLFYGKHLTNHVFEWYLDVCSFPELEGIIETKLTEKQAEVLAKRFTKELENEVAEKEEIEKEVEELTEKDKKIISGYIDQAKKLRSQIETQKETINTILHRSESYYQNMNFLYNLMGDKMEFKDGASLSDEEVETINEIDEVTNE